MLGLESCTITQHDDTMDTIQHDGTMDTTQHDGTMDTLNTTTTQHDESTGRTSANQCRMDALEIRVVPLVGSANDPPVYDARITALQLLQCLFMDLQEEMLEVAFHFTRSDETRRVETIRVVQQYLPLPLPLYI